MIATVYGSFYNATGTLNPATVVIDYINGGDPEWREQMEASGAIDAIVGDYVDAINAALPDGVSLVGDEIIGPHRTDEDYDEDFTLDVVASVANEIDLAEIVERHEKAAGRSALEAITEAVNARTAATEALDAAEEAVAEAVRAALNLEVPATKVADHLGVTRARIYQIRDGRR